jgi:hypothetical protein
VKKTAVLIATLLLSQFALAGKCDIVVDRTPCPGKDAEAWKPYNGKNPAPDSNEKVDTEDACLKWAEKSSKIQRKGALAKKKVTSVSFNGKDLGKTFEGAPSECK